MNPALSVIFLTTLIGVGQGLFTAVFASEVYSTLNILPKPDKSIYFMGSCISVAFLALGLLASFFHLGHPERAWRAASQWRTSWLSREVIALPLAMFFIAAYGLIHYFEFNVVLFNIKSSLIIDLTLAVGTIAVVAILALFLCTGMIYASIRFLQEWATPLTVINFTLFGMASGLCFSTVFAYIYIPNLTSIYAVWAIVFTVAAFFTRAASLIRNAKIKYRSTLKTAIGVKHSRITQRSQGFMGGSFNTREFFHGMSQTLMPNVKWIFLALVFPIPIALIVWGINKDMINFYLLAFVVQYCGLLIERWFFFAQANHPQNLYYQTVG